MHRFAPEFRRLALACLFAWSLLPVVAAAADLPPGVFDFEAGRGPRPDQWLGPEGSVSVDSTVVHGGQRSARIQRTATSEGSFSALNFRVPADREGTTIELRGWVKTEGVDPWFGLWFRQDGPAGAAAFDNMQSRHLSGTTDWTEYRVSLPLKSETRTFVVGALMVGTGTLWADDLSLWIDGKPYADAPLVEREPTVLDTDTEFNEISGMPFLAPTARQADHLALLGRVWGFLKYHHPAVTAGRVHWDFALFRVLPEMVAAADADAARRVLVDWIDDLGPIPPCAPCAEPLAEAAQPPGIDWIHDAELLGPDLVARLEAVYAARPAGGEQFYVGITSRVGNPQFDHEPAYEAVPETDAGYRLLTLFRFWNIVAYCCPNRDIADQDWPALLRDQVPRFSTADGKEAYRLAVWALVASLHDTHTQLNVRGDIRPPGGDARLPVAVRWIEERAVVAGYTHEFLGPATGLERGDAILAVDGRPVAELFAEWRPYYSASNEPRLMKQLAEALGRGEAGSCRLTVLREGRTIELTAERAGASVIDHLAYRYHTLGGPGYRVLAPGVAYMPLEAIKRDSVQTWIGEALAADVRGLVIDCRSYPGDFPVFELGGHLVTEPTRFVTFTRLDPRNPGAFRWDGYLPLQPILPHFDRPVVVLVDEVSLSSAEYHALAFSAAPQAIVMGSTTAGADGNISRFSLPGGLSTVISGIGVYDADRNNTQRAGIVPDVEVTPTIAGIRAGRDEVLEAAVARIVGREVSGEEAADW